MRNLLPLLILTLPACDVDPDADPLDAERPELCPPGFVDDGDGCAFDEDAVIEVMRTFDQGDLVKVNDVPFMQVMGPSLERNIWVSPVPVPGTDMTAVELYALVRPMMDEPLPAEFPVGTLIIHETIDRSEGHTVQVKRGEDYDDGFGRNWWTGKFFDDGEPDQDPCSPCVMCHNDDMRPDSDGLYGLPDDAF